MHRAAEKRVVRNADECLDAVSPSSKLDTYVSTYTMVSWRRSDRSG
jgi:hypothetical protein